MRARNIKPGFFKNEFLAEIPFDARLLFIGLWCYADREGLLEYRPKKVSAEIFPYETFDISSKLATLVRTEFCQIYKNPNGPNIIKIVNFLKHQRPHKNEKDSILKDIIKTCDLGSANDVPRNVQCCPDSLIEDSLIEDSLIEDSLIHKDKKKHVAADKTPQPVSRAVESYREVYLRYPNKRYWPGIDDKISSKSDHAIEKWKTILKEAVLNPKISIGTALDWYENGVTEWRGGKLVRREPELPPMMP